MRCLETRVGQFGLTRRRYQTESGARFTTYELPASAVSEIGPKKLKEIAERAQRVLQRSNRKATAIGLIRDGWKPEAIAHHLGISPQMVRQYRLQEKKRAQEQ